MNPQPKPDSVPRALIIDDDPHLVEAVTEILEAMGHAWEKAGSVDEAVAKAKGGSFNYILCDLELPQSYGRLPILTHGLGLIETLAQMPACKGTPIIVITGHGDSVDLMVETRRRGAYDLVPKPFSRESLREAIRLALRGEHRAP